MLHTVSILLEDGLIPLSRVVGALRRPNAAVTSIAMGPSPQAGCSRLTVRMNGETAAVDQILRLLRRVVAVRCAVRISGEQAVVREHALISVRSGPGQCARIIETVGRLRCGVAEERPDVVIVEAAGTADSVSALIEALEPFGIIDVARSEAVVNLSQDGRS